VFGRTRRGKPVPPGQWYWPGQRTHPGIVDRDTWETAQKVGAEHRSSRDGAMHNPASWRSYLFRSRIRCKICHRRMCGLTKVHAASKTPTEYAYYVCQYNPNTPAMWPPAPATRAPSRSAKMCC
jgi:site-specific DNA recombinase